MVPWGSGLCGVRSACARDTASASAASLSFCCLRVSCGSGAGTISRRFFTELEVEARASEAAGFPARRFCPADEAGCTCGVGLAAGTLIRRFFSTVETGCVVRFDPEALAAGRVVGLGAEAAWTFTGRCISTIEATAVLVGRTSDL